MKSTERYPTKIIQSREENTGYRQFINIDSIMNSDSDYAETGEIEPKKGKHKVPSLIQANNFNFTIPHDAKIRKVTVEFAHKSTGDIDIAPPTVELIDVDAKKANGITDEFTKNEVVFDVTPSVFKINSPSFGVRIKYPANTSENAGSIQIQYLKLIVSYDMPGKLNGLLKFREFIKITDVNVTGNRVSYSFETSPLLDDVFAKKEMFVEYMNMEGIDLASVPQGILVIPLISNLLPIVWLLDCKLIVDELDEDFYNAIPKMKQGYMYMYKKAQFKGEISVNSLTNNRYEYENKYLSLFSYGVDSLNTVLKYIDDRPMLLTLWGSDIPLNEQESWNVMSSNIDGFAKDYNLDNFYVKSDFRKFINTASLYQTFSEYLESGSNWWHNVQHGIAILSQATIPAYIFRVERILFASTHAYSKEDLSNRTNIVPCASSPFIDNEFRFAGCSVIHDGCEFERGEKLDNIVEYSRKNDAKFNMHVCWFDLSGYNCNVCEKCARTYMYIMALGEDPSDYGFDIDDETLKTVERNFKDVIFNGKKIGGWAIHTKTLNFWKINQEKFRQNEDYWKDTNVGWLLDLDIDEIRDSLDR